MSTRSFKPVIKLPAKRRVKASPFSLLSKSKQRVAIALDAMEQIHLARYTPTTGAFINVVVGHDVSRTTSLRSIVEGATPEAPCRVCALGAILASLTLVNGDVKLGKLRVQEAGDPVEDVTHITPYVERAHGTFSPFILTYFTVAQLQMIEIAFERGIGAFYVREAVGEYRRGVPTRDNEDWKESREDYDVTVTLDQAAKALEFGQRYEDSDPRLWAVLSNIVLNGGTFVP